FGLLLEEGDQLIFGTYEYAPGFVLAIDRAPLVIGLTWALIIAGAMRITDALGTRRRWAPFVDSILAIMLDLSFDAIAIRIGLWTWRDHATGTPLSSDAAWFGVPAGNFYAWLFVTLGFSLLTRWLRDRAPRGSAMEWLQLLVPIPAFAILLLSLVPFTILQPMIDPTPGGGKLLFLLTFAAFLAAAAWGVFGPDRGRPDGQGTAILDLRLAFFTRAAIHLFFLGALVVSGLALGLPVLLAVAVALLLLEVPLAWLAATRLRASRREDAAGAEERAVPGWRPSPASSADPAE
ncbi:MAG: carotenoid biosynthesis protein, partial [Chloroflexi bacterium]|nr:carotenoid biosynthesis protein [Chloroflexota bacterium]